MELLNLFPRRRNQRGASLVEALVATVVMAFGMIAVSGIQGRLRYSGDHAKQKAEATRLAQSEMEQLRGYVALTRSPDTPAGALVFEDIVGDRRTIDAVSTRFSLQRAVSALDDGSKEVRVTVSWSDRQRGEKDEPLTMEWKTAVARADPVLLVAARSAPAFGVAQRRAQDRHPGIPLRAHGVGEGRSVFKPEPGGSTALVFDNVSGMVTGVCEVGASTAAESLTIAGIADCAHSLSVAAFLLSGHVLYATGSTPDPAAPRDPVVPAGMALTLSSAPHGSAPSCYTDASRNAAAGIQALDYYCLIEPRTPPSSDPDKRFYWSGRSELTLLPLGPGAYRVCRYSDDYDGDGRIANAEHPARYDKVSESLALQNFLVVRFEASCPAGQRIDLAAARYRNTVTVAHQP